MIKKKAGCLFPRIDLRVGLRNSAFIRCVSLEWFKKEKKKKKKSLQISPVRCYIRVRCHCRASTGRNQHSDASLSSVSTWSVISTMRIVPIGTVMVPEEVICRHQIWSALSLSLSLFVFPLLCSVQPVLPCWDVSKSKNEGLVALSCAKTYCWFQRWSMITVVGSRNGHSSVTQWPGYGSSWMHQLHYFILQSTNQRIRGR